MAECRSAAVGTWALLRGLAPVNDFHSFSESQTFKTSYFICHKSTQAVKTSKNHPHTRAPPKSFAMTSSPPAAPFILPAPPTHHSQRFSRNMTQTLKNQPFLHFALSVFKTVSTLCSTVRILHGQQSSAAVKIEKRAANSVLQHIVEYQNKDLKISLKVTIDQPGVLQMYWKAFEQM